MMRGILYIASGDEFIDEMEISAQSAKEQMDINIALISDQEYESEYIDDMVIVDEMRHDFGDHVNFINKSPYDQTLKCDTDIYFCDEVWELFDILEEFDIGVSQASYRHSTGRIEIPETEEVPDSFPEYQGGVIVFEDNNSFKDFHQIWKSGYQSTLDIGHVSNQASLRAALYNTRARIATLPEEYNCVIRNPGVLNGKVKMIHNRLNKTDGLGGKKFVDTHKAKRQINKKDELRAYYRSGGRIKIAEPNILMKFRDSVIRDGIWKTLKKPFQVE